MTFKILCGALFLAFVGALAALVLLPTRDSQKPKATAYAKAISTYQGRSDLQDVKRITDGTYTAVFSDACFLIDLSHPALDIETRC